ncbi:chromate efflux transporter [Flavobacterium sp. DG2-3]|uniref:chromate efflux transporter n=1 Tax=Flavobacterium sp. DG2-3 TaxID=3068317 RepID=UPI00273EB4C3|nr:chromate efflux transporter [Flavobacterium sp. DG2-3]MDP5200294.1 chromate efflux transporter [Flavobacterium sp. DG2-3]
MEHNANLKEIFQVFIKLGTIGFGGPAAHIAMMHEEVVIKRKWMAEQHFLDLIGATSLIPGPNSTEMAIHIGYIKGGWKGLLVAGFCFIMPAVLITGFFAYLYRSYGQLPQVQPFIYGIKPAVIAIIIGAVYPLAVKSIKSLLLGLIAITVLTASILGINEICLLFGSGLLASAVFYIQKMRTDKLQSFTPFALMAIPQTAFWSGVDSKLFLIFLKIGAILYGSGYVLFAFLDTELAAKGLLTKQQLIDAIAIGQFTPGPLFSSVTFIGYQINGLSGAAISTIAIFLPSFIFVALLHQLMKKLRTSKGLAVFMDAVNVASIALIAAVCLAMANEAITDWRTIAIAAISCIAIFKLKKINSALVVILGAVLGYFLAYL